MGLTIICGSTSGRWSTSQLSVSARWVKSHLDKKPLLIDNYGFAPRDVTGNFAADALASAAGRKAGPPLSDVSDILSYAAIT